VSGILLASAPEMGDSCIATLPGPEAQMGDSCIATLPGPEAQMGDSCIATSLHSHIACKTNSAKHLHLDNLRNC
jgi:hypothetical protein